MVTLQKAYEILSAANLTPYYVLKSTGKRSPQSIELYCPGAYFAEMEKIIKDVLPEGFALTYNTGREVFIISTLRFVFQFIANLIHSADSCEQLKNCENFLSAQYDYKAIDGAQFDTLHEIIYMKNRLLSH